MHQIPLCAYPETATWVARSSTWVELLAPPKRTGPPWVAQARLKKHRSYLGLPNGRITPRHCFPPPWFLRRNLAM